MTIENKVLSSLSYLSILFMPVLFPLIVWILTSDRPQTRHYAANALIIHLFPAIFLFAILIVAGVRGAISDDSTSVGWLLMILLGIFAIVSIGFFIYSIYKGIKILVN